MIAVSRFWRKAEAEGGGLPEAMLHNGSKSKIAGSAARVPAYVTVDMEKVTTSSNWRRGTPAIS